MGQATLRAVGATAANSSLTTWISADCPASTAADDMLVAFVTESTAVPDTPSGWTAGPKNGNFGIGSFQVAVFWKWATAGGAASTTFTWTGTGSFAVAAIVAVSGMNNVGNPVSASAVSDTTLTVPSMTSTRGSGLLLTAHASNASPYSPPPAMLEIADLVNPTNGMGVELNQRSADTSPQGAQTPASVPAYGGTPCSLGLVVSQDNVAPNAPTLNSPDGITVDRGVTQRFGWTFSDPGDSQSAFALQYRLGAGSWTPVTGTTPNAFWDAPPSTFSAGSYEWQCRTTDALGLQGPYSASSFFTAADSTNVPSITAPTSGGTVSAATATVSWSAGNQTDYQVRRVADLAGAADAGTIYYDSGDVVNGATRSLAGVSFPVNLQWEHIQVRVKYAGLWSTWADCRVYVSWTAPVVPTFTATPASATASIVIAITNAAGGGGEPAVSYNDVYVSSPLDQPAIRIATGVPPNISWTWWWPGAGRLYQLRVVAVGTNGTTASSDNLFSNTFSDIF